MTVDRNNLKSCSVAAFETPAMRLLQRQETREAENDGLRERFFLVEHGRCVERGVLGPAIAKELLHGSEYEGGARVHEEVEIVIATFALRGYAVLSGLSVVSWRACECRWLWLANQTLRVA